MTKRYKTFLATWKPAGGVIRVVLVDEPTGWRAYVCTDPSATVADILTAVADRFAREQGCQRMKEELGLAHFEGRSWRGFHHHVCLVMLAYGFLALEQLRAKRDPVKPGKQGIASQGPPSRRSVAPCRGC